MENNPLGIILEDTWIEGGTATHRLLDPLAHAKILRDDHFQPKLGLNLSALDELAQAVLGLMPQEPASSSLGHDEGFLSEPFASPMTLKPAMSAEVFSAQPLFAPATIATPLDDLIMPMLYAGSDPSLS